MARNIRSRKQAAAHQITQKMAHRNSSTSGTTTLKIWRWIASGTALPFFCETSNQTTERAATAKSKRFEDLRLDCQRHGDPSFLQDTALDK